MLKVKTDRFRPVDQRLFRSPIPEVKNISPSIASAQGLSVTKSWPKIPNTPNTSPIIPTIVKISPRALIIHFVFLRDSSVAKCFL
jgi:hypothetical protein